MAKNSGLGALLTGLALGAAALYLKDEKNRKKVKSAVGDISDTAKEFHAQWQQDPDAAIASLKEKAKALTSKLDENKQSAGAKLTAASKKAMLKALEETERLLKTARKNLAEEKTTELAAEPMTDGVDTAADAAKRTVRRSARKIDKAAD